MKCGGFVNKRQCKFDAAEGRNYCGIHTNQLKKLNQAIVASAMHITTVSEEYAALPKTIVFEHNDWYMVFVDLDNLQKMQVRLTSIKTIENMTQAEREQYLEAGL